MRSLYMPQDGDMGAGQLHGVMRGRERIRYLRPLYHLPREQRRLERVGTLQALEAFLHLMTVRRCPVSGMCANQSAQQKYQMTISKNRGCQEYVP